ncbi:MAG: hypothetical protein ABSB68_06760 [Acidimicrobiales bacterium]
MRLSTGRVSPSGTTCCEDTANDLHRTARARMTLAMAVVLLLGAIGIVFGSTAKPAAAAGTDTPIQFAAGQVFASVGGSSVGVYSRGNPSAVPPTSPALLATLSDGLGETYSAGSAFDAHGNLYVTDDFLGDVVEYSPTGAYMGVFASGLQNPLSVAFDALGNLYVGQQGTNTIAEFSPSGALVRNIGPVPTENAGTDWITLANQCTIDYTSEGTDILSYNICPASPTNTPGPVPNVNTVPFSTMDPESNLPTDEAYELQVRPNGQVLVADSSEVILLNPNGSVAGTYACSSLAAYGAGCYDSLFAVSLDPDGLSFWTADSVSGYIWQVDIATGQVLQTIDTQSGTLFGLSVDNQIEVAGPTQVTTATPSTLAIQPVTGNFSTPTPVTGVLTNPGTDTPLVDEPVTFTLNGNPTESCTATTNSTGTATCDITASEPSSTYTLTASFAGDTTPSTPIGSDSTSSTFTVNPDTSSLTYTGPTTGVNGQPITLSGTLTNETTAPTSSLSTKVVTFTIGSGSTEQSCNAVTDGSGDVSCTIPSLDQPQTAESVTSSFTGDSYDTPSTVTTGVTVTEPTVLTVNTATSDYSDSTMVSGVLTDANTNAPISGEPVTFTLDNNETCTATTDSTGTATCPITPGEPAATYTLTGSFGGDPKPLLQLTGSGGSANFVVTLEETALTYTGGTVAQNGQPLTLSGVLTTDNGVGLGGRTVTFTLGSGSTVQTCSAVSAASGAASCVVTVANQPQGPIPVADTFTSDGYYQSASASSTVNLPEGTSLTVTPGTGTYNGSTTVSATLINTYTNAPVPGQSVTLTVNGTQTCSGTTNASGVATCSVTPNEPSGTYSLSGSFGGNTTTTPVLLSSSGSSTFTESKAPTTLTYTGSTSTTSGQSPSLSATLTTTGGTPLPGQTVTFTVGTGSSAQRCTATTNSAGHASCSICMYNQSASPLPVTVTYGGNSYYGSTTTSQSVTVVTPTNLSVSAATGTYGQPVTVSGTLTNSVNGQGIGGQTVTLTLNSSQTCTATTASNGKASCAITPTETSGTYTLTGSFGGNTTTSPQLLASNGSNKVVVNGAPTSITYTGTTTTTNGQSLTLSTQLTSNGTPLNGQPVVLTLGTGRTAQSCTATTGTSGTASCQISSVNQVTGTVTVTVSYAGNSNYAASSNSAGIKVSGCGGGGGGGGGGGSGGGGSGGGCGGSGVSEPPPVGGGRGCC